MPDEGHKGERAAPSLVILGGDALLAAQPATAVQLAHACLRVGYHAVVPASWGDELIAGGCLKQIASRRSGGDSGPAIFCACPHVAHRLLAVGPDLEPFLTSFVAPPVAVARYLRTLYEPTRLRLTYVGRCPGAADDAIDARLTPDELLAVLVERGVDLAQQPRVFDSVIPPDRRRFLSQPGGLPTADALRRVDPDRRTAEVTGPELVAELAQHLLSKASVLVDVSTRLGCACSGAVAGASAAGARASVTALEPPRASSSVVDDRVPVAIELPLPPVSRNLVDVVPSVAGRRTSGASRAVQEPDAPVPSAPPSGAESHAPPGVRRRSPAQGVTVRQPPTAVPTTRSGEGRALPRAYVARRNTGARGRGPSTPPRGEAAQRFGASRTPTAGRGANGGGPRGVGRGGGAPSPSATPPARTENEERQERQEREERGEPADRVVHRVEMPRSTFPPPPAEPSAREMALGSSEPRAAAATIGAPPDRATDPYGEPFNIPDDVVQEAARAVADLRGPSPISEVGAAPAASFRVRSAAFARMAVGAAQQRRAIVAALLAVALLSASVGVLAGRWLAARTAEPAATR